jgi:hypothetical protein
LKKSVKLLSVEAASEVPGDEKPLARGGVAGVVSAEASILLAGDFGEVALPFTKMRVNSPGPWLPADAESESVAGRGWTGLAAAGTVEACEEGL